MTPFRRLLRLTSPFATRIGVAVLMGAATVGSSIGLMATGAYLLSAAALRPSIAELGVAIVGVRFFGLARGVFRYLERIASHSVNLRLLTALRLWFYQAIEPLAPAGLVSARSGDLLARAVADIETLQDFYVRVLAPPGVAIVVLLGTSAFLGSVHPLLVLTLVGFALLGGALLPLAVLRLSRKPGAAAVAQRAALNAEVVDNLQGLADLVAFGAVETRLDRVRLASDSLAAAQRRLLWIQAAQSSASGLVAHLAMWTVLAVGVSQVQAGRVDGVVLAALALGTLAAFEAVIPLPLAAQSLEAALPAARRIFDLADQEPAVREPSRPGTIAESRATPSLEVHGLRFAYVPGDAPVLQGLELEVPAGKRLALVGPSGAGKTTLANLILRFWDYSQGEIRLDGIDIRSLSSEETRSRIAVIAQGTYLFNASLQENLLLANPEASRAAMEGALRGAQLDRLVATLPDGLATRIGERGLSLSAGERQRLAIARALLRPAGFLLLDEPTANLDPVTEQRVLEALLPATHGRTTLWITHRLVGLESVDGILVMERGRIIERGSHAELVQLGGLYASMWKLQNRAWDALSPLPAAGIQSA
jgi:thiol reductant ABC exporter CydC subunit